MSQFLSTLAITAGNPLYAKLAPSSWEECLNYLDHSLPKQDHPCCIVFDELPWMAASKLDLVRALFKIWELKWSQRKRLMLIVCGSAVGFLDKHFIRSTQFYGRASLSIHLPPLTLSEVGEFFGNKRTPDEVLELMMVFGGIPKYLEQVEHRDSVRQAVNHLCFEPTSFFLEELPHLFRSSFIRDSTRYKDVVKVLLRHHSLDYPGVASAINGARGSGLKQILDNLVLSDFIEKFSPVDKPSATNLMRFRLSDEFTRFYYQFMEPRLNVIRHNEAKHDIFDLVLPERKYFTWKSRAFERVVQKHAATLADFLGISVVVENYGTYFDRRGEGPQIDLLYLRRDKTITACEIKYSENPLPLSKGLVEQIKTQHDYLKRHFTSRRIEHILVTNTLPSDSLKRADLFHRIVRIQDVV